MKTFYSCLFLILYLNVLSQSGLVSGNYSVSTIPVNNGDGTFNISGSFSDPKGQYFASDVDTGMVFWKGNNFYLIDSILSVSGPNLDIRVQDTYTTGFIPTGVAQIVELTPNLALPGVSTTGDSNPALATPPDYAALMNYLIQRIDNIFGGSGLDLDSLVDARLVGPNLELELVSGQVVTAPISAIDTSAWRTTGGAKQNDQSGFAYRTGNTTIGVVDSNTHKFRADGSFQFNPESGFVFDFQEGNGILGPVDHKGLVITSNLDNLSGSWPPPDGSNLSFFKNSIATDRDLLGSLSFLGRDNLGNVYNGGGISFFADGNWTNGSALGTSVNIWATAPTETFARNVATFQGDGRFELDRYSIFDDGVPISLAGFSAAGLDLTRHIIDGSSPVDTALLLFDPVSTNHFFWSDLETLLSDGGFGLWQENDTVVFYNGIKDVGIGNNTATEKLHVTGNIRTTGNLILDGINQKIVNNYLSKIRALHFADNEITPNIDNGTTGGRWTTVNNGDEDGGIVLRSTRRSFADELEDVVLVHRGTAGVGIKSTDAAADARFAIRQGGHNTDYILRVLDAANNSEFQIANDGTAQIGTKLQFASGARLVAPSFTEAGRDALSPDPGEIIFNTTDSLFQGYARGEWYTLEFRGTNRTITADASFQDSDAGAMVSIDDTTNDSDFSVYTLPASPWDGLEIECNCISANIDADDGCQVARNGNNINAAAADYTFSGAQFEIKSFKFHEADNTWYVY